MPKTNQMTDPGEPMRDDLLVVRRENEIALVSETVNRRQVHEQHIARLRLLWCQRMFLLRFSVLGLAASLLVAFLIPSRYTSSARLMPPESDSNAGLATVAAALAGSTGIAGMASSLLGIKNSSDIFVGVLGSRTAQDSLIQEFDLKTVYGVRRLEDARTELANRTTVVVDRKSQIITIQVTDTSPQRSSELAGAYVEELNRLVVELSTSSARRERIFLEERLKQVRADLEAAEKSFSEFASKNTTIDITEQGKAMVGAAASLQGELIASQSELEGLKQIYSENNVRVRSLSARVAELKSQLDKLVGKGDVSTSSSDGLMYPSIRKLPLLGVSYADLFRQTKVQEAVFETLTKEYEMAKVQEAKEIPTVKVLDSPDVPERKSFPPRALIGFLGFVLSLCVGVAMVFGAARWKAIDPLDPGKALAHEVFVQLSSQHINWPANGGDSQSITKKIQKALGWKSGVSEMQ
jgi:uncharacterized protein involved in exopolysaccharide biosynthesis